MRRFFGILLVLVALATFGSGQTMDKKPGKDEQTRQTLMQVERDIGTANISRDYAFFDRVEADEFVFTDSSGGVTTKKEDLESVKGPASPNSKLLSYEVDDMKVMLYGKMAVVMGRSTLKGTNKDVAWTSQSRFTDVFVWRDDRWQLVAGHSSRIRQK
jgi:ketosteroid isomerase-like protein